MEWLIRAATAMLIFGLTMTGSANTLSAADMKRISVFNDCDVSEVWIALRIRNAQGWRTVYWWSFGPGEIAPLFEDDIPLKTNNRTAYYFAEGGKAVWSGEEDDVSDRTYRVRDRELRFRKVTLDVDEEGDYFLRIGCSRITEELMEKAIEDDDVPAVTEMRIVYKPFVYAYAWLVDKRRYPHVYVVAVNPKDKSLSYYTDAGKFGFKRKTSSRYCADGGQLCAIVRNASTILESWPNQQVFYVKLPFNEVVGRMRRYARATNIAKIDYRYYDRNCSGYAFSFIREALNRNIRPNPPMDPGDDIKVIGWQKRLDVDWRALRFSTQ